jgi:hypothetical protein
MKNRALHKRDRWWMEALFVLSLSIALTLPLLLLTYHVHNIFLSYYTYMLLPWKR